MGGIVTGTQFLELGLILLVAYTGKLLGAIIPARILGMARREAVTLSLLMNTRCLTERIILNAAVSLGVLGGQMFTIIVIMASFTTALAGPLLPRGKALQHSAPNPSPSKLGHLTVRAVNRTIGTGR